MQKKPKKPVVAATATVEETKKQDKPSVDDKIVAGTAEIIEDDEDEDVKKNVRRRVRRE